MTDVPPTTPPAADPNADELAALRKEKADRAAAEAKTREDELAELRAFKANAEKAPVVKAPEKKADKAPDPAATPPATPPATTKKKGRDGASRAWFGSDE